MREYRYFFPYSDYVILLHAIRSSPSLHSARVSICVADDLMSEESPYCVSLCCPLMSPCAHTLYLKHIVTVQDNRINACLDFKSVQELQVVNVAQLAFYTL